jgi:hypothetical protein
VLELSIVALENSSVGPLKIDPLAIVDLYLIFFCEIRLLSEHEYSSNPLVAEVFLGNSLCLLFIPPF